MADRTKIEWTDATWNPVRGCTRVSEGCRNCYAEVMAARFSDPGQWGHGIARRVTLPNGTTDHRWTGKVALAEHLLDQPLRWRAPRHVFVNSTSDLFHESIPEDWIDRVFAVMALAPQHTFQVLTKRPERMRRYLQALDIRRLVRAALPFIAGKDNEVALWDIPLPNVWLGTSIENQITADERIPVLLDTLAAVRFVSAEPLLGPVRLPGLIQYASPGNCVSIDGDWWHEPGSCSLCRPALDWIITGGESGPGARPMHPDWARMLRDQCHEAGVAFFFKQWGEWEASLDRDRDDPDFREDYKRNYVDRGNSKWLNLEGGRGFHGDRFHVMRRVGKAIAGRLLDGRTWDQMPGGVVGRYIRRGSGDV